MFIEVAEGTRQREKANRNRESNPHQHGQSERRQPRTRRRVEVNAFESVRLKPEPMPPLVRALLYPANSPSARIPVSPTPRVGSKWRTGKPLHAGWWLTRLGYSKAEWRWWYGERWSLPSSSSNSAVDAAAVAQFASNTSFAMAWCMDWPEGARVQRINPETGEVTGGAA